MRFVAQEDGNLEVLDQRGGGLVGVVNQMILRVSLKKWSEFLKLQFCYVSLSLSWRHLSER